MVNNMPLCWENQIKWLQRGTQNVSAFRKKKTFHNYQKTIDADGNTQTYGGQREVIKSHRNCTIICSRKTAHDKERQRQGKHLCRFFFLKFSSLNSFQTRTHTLLRITRSNLVHGLSQLRKHRKLWCKNATGRDLIKVDFARNCRSLLGCPQ